MRVKITRTTKSKAGMEYVEFDQKRDDGRWWSAPLWLVEKGVDKLSVRPGVEVLLETGEHPKRGLEVKKVSLAQGASAGGPATPAPPHIDQPARHRADAAVAGGGKHRLPYGFVAIDTTKSVLDSPVWHDGSIGDDLLSGEIRCTVTALTPFLPGNFRYPISVAPSQLGYPNASVKKQVAEPLRLKDGRVVIPGSALKGMLRHSLGALLSAPMERVAEHHYSYRPNLDFNGIEAEKLVFRPALIVGRAGDGWELRIFDSPRAALFVREAAEATVRQAIEASQNKAVSVVAGVDKERNHLVFSPGKNTTFDHPMRLVKYKGGIDGVGYLAAAFNKRSKTYSCALVPAKYLCGVELSADVYERFLAHQANVLATEHLTSHPLKFDQQQVSSEIKKNKFEVGQLIYVELKTDGRGITSDSEVVSCGQHFRYRWAYSSSVRMQAGKPRACLTPAPAELSSPPNWVGKADVPPEKLTGARLLFGYVHDKDNAIGKGAYTRLAGRIAINHAVSKGVPKFLGEAPTHCVPLKILGQPKTSAWEFYVEQEAAGQLNTYGDLPGDAGGELRGRKFYRHWPACSETHIKATDQDTINSDQSTLARFICGKGTEFRFTIRFARLRPWELGALFAVIEPRQLAGAGVEKKFAHKLGLGRPLGMGSVQLEAEELYCRKEGETALRVIKLGEKESALSAFREKIAGLESDILRAWLDTHEFADHGALAYPTDQTRVDGEQKQAIYAWHTNVRRAYSKLRRQQKANWTVLRTKLTTADPP